MLVLVLVLFYSASLKGLNMISQWTIIRKLGVALLEDFNGVIN